MSRKKRRTKMKFKLWQSADMQEPMKIIKANSYKKALELALEVCGYTLTQGDEDEVEWTNY